MRKCFYFYVYFHIPCTTPPFLYAPDHSRIHSNAKCWPRFWSRSKAESCGRGSSWSFLFRFAFFFYRSSTEFIFVKATSKSRSHSELYTTVGAATGQFRDSATRPVHLNWGAAFCVFALCILWHFIIETFARDRVINTAIYCTDHAPST